MGKFWIDKDSQYYDHVGDYITVCQGSSIVCLMQVCFITCEVFLNKPDLKQK